MATPGRAIDPDVRRTIERLRDAGRSIRAIAREAGVCKRTVEKYIRKENSETHLPK